MIDTHFRTLVKTLGWTLWRFVTGLLLLLMFGQDLWTATTYSVILNIFLFFTYYIYERIWDRINWGRNK